MTIFLGILLVAALAAVLWTRRQGSTRARLLATPLTDHERAVVAQQVPLTRRLPAEFREGFEGRINRFRDQVDFIGCDGLDVTEEMELSIAAQAALLVVGSGAWYDTLRTVLIYPGAFTSQRTEHNGYVVTRRQVARTGESWARGPVVLSWAHSRQGAMNERDGHNVVFHEFAHQLDALSGQTDGVPVLARDQSYADWDRAFATAYARHVRQVQAGHRTVIDPYGAEGREEFFAVLVEAFFEKPGTLRREEPAIYDQMSRLFRLSPDEWPVRG
ncbi:zinc-dependent peptidase [Pseudooceanicola sp. LIPI14-2-Ac024]|uniref:M90 family metallopeptidase n=1 Tax=Pseudooceanicola sp. LIPI14-2-Ac024 TaxID=3344875 RepID=UPI0035D05000